MVRMIEHITGRKVKVVPPFAYFVSAAPSRVPERPDVEVVLATDVASKRRTTTEPLVVDVSAVLHDISSDRLIVGAGDGDGLAVVAGVDVEL